MKARNALLGATPYPVEQALKKFGGDLKTARLRRNLTAQEAAQKIGTSRFAVADAEKGKPSTGIAVYMAHLWVLGIINQMDHIASPEKDEEGQILALSRERKRARKQTALDNDF